MKLSNLAERQLREWVQQQPHVHVDETPWPVLGLKEWLWVVAEEKFCLFHAGDTRSRAELEQQLGSEFDGVLSSDDRACVQRLLCDCSTEMLGTSATAFQEGGEVGVR